VAALTAGIFLVLGIAEILVEKQVVMPSFAELERGNAASPCDASTLHSTW